MENRPVEQHDVEETLMLIQKIWVLFVIVLYAVCFFNEARFPGMREEPLEGEEILWQIERVLYFGLLGLGLLTDIVQARLDKSKAFLYLFASLILGGLSAVIGAWHYKMFSTVFG